MRAKIEELCNDPLFQLNLGIWLSQSNPEGFSVRPLLYEAGFQILSVGPLLALPPDIRLRIETSLNCQDVARPDLIFEADNRTRLLILECKRSSFGRLSTTASQARTLLLLSGPIISEALAIGKRSSAEGILCYLTRSSQIPRLEHTLSELTKELQDQKLDAGVNGCLGIRPDDTAILLEYSDELRTLLKCKPKSPVAILNLEEDTDPHPLYFIPYDPNIEQSKGEQALSRRILYERFLGHILSKIGPAAIPSEVVFITEEVLNAATFNVYAIWDDAEAKKHTRRLFKDFMGSLRNALKEEQKKSFEYQVGRGWIFKFKDMNSYDEILAQVSKFNPDTLDLTKTIAPTLFDE